MTLSETRKPCVLIVDHNQDLAAFMQLALIDAGYDVHLAFSGPEALAWLTRQKPDVLVLDLMLPAMNGFTILRQLRAGESTGPLPVIILTARDEQLDPLAGESVGATGVLVKPIDTQELVEHVRRALTRSSIPTGASHADRV